VHIREQWTDCAATEAFHLWFGYSLISSKFLRKVLTTKYQKWTKFTVVRNPYNRFRSLYYDKIKQNNPSAEMDDFIKTFKKNAWYKNDHGRPQCELVGGDLSMYDFVGRTESLDDVFSFLSKVLNKTIESRHENKVTRKGDQSLTVEQKSEIYKFYKEDFDLLGYAKIAQ